MLFVSDFDIFLILASTCTQLPGIQNLYQWSRSIYTQKVFFFLFFKYHIVVHTAEKRKETKKKKKSSVKQACFYPHAHQGKLLCMAQTIIPKLSKKEPLLYSGNHRRNKRCSLVTNTNSMFYHYSTHLFTNSMFYHHSSYQPVH